MAAPEKKKLSPESEAVPSASRRNFTEESLAEIWQQLLIQSGFAVQADLRKVSSTAISGPNALVMRVSRRYNTPASVFGDPAKLAKVQEVLNQIVDSPCSLRIE